MIVYISGPYTGTPSDIITNIEKARRIAIELWEKGYTALTPHLNTMHFENDCKATYDQYIKGDLELLSRCDAMVVVPDYESSKGTLREIEHAKCNNIPVYFYPELPKMVNYSAQDDSFINVLMNMYRMYVKKSRDYSPANILGTGEIGLVTRLWDKMARLMNLSGFKLKVETCTFLEPKNPNNESLDDTYSDLANYAIIGQLLRKGQWGNEN